MSAISSKDNLKQAHLDYILLSLSKTTDMDKIKQSFQEFFETGIKGEVLLEVSREYKDEVITLRSKIPFSEKVADIDIASPEKQLELLSKLREECMKERVVNVTRDGTPITKVDLPTAARCIELANRVITNEEGLRLRRLELEQQDIPTGMPSTPENTTTVSSGPVIQIVHKKSAKEELE